MKKQFVIKESNKAPARQVEAFKHEIKKYVARERRKDLPEGADFWDFACKIGPNENSMQETHLSQINTGIDQIINGGGQEFCIEIVAQAKTRKKKQ